MLRHTWTGIVCVGCASAALGATSTFTASAEGWSVLSFANLSTDSLAPVRLYSPTYNATGGNPGGYLSMGDPDGGDSTYSAPSAFLGNQLAAYGTNLTYDLIYLSGTVNYQTTDVLLAGSGPSSPLLYKPTTPFVPTTSWQTNTVPLSATTGWHIGTSTGPQPTAAQFQSVLSTLSSLYIRGEYTVGSETSGIDNVSLIPEPAGLTAIAGVTLLLGRRTRRDG